MARPVTITDEQILDAARTVFLEEGFGAQTARIAQRAGISEGTIFKRFKTKEGLFLAALELDTEPPWRPLAERLIGNGDVRENLAAIMSTLLQHLLEVVPRLFALIGNPMVKGNHTPLESIHGQDVFLLDDFLRREIALGRLAPCDTGTLVAVIMGSLIEYTIRTSTGRSPMPPQEDPQIFVQNMVRLLWNGIAPVSN